MLWMVSVRDNLKLAVESVTAYKLRAVLTVLGLTMGVATLMTVMTLVQGANLYVEQKIANLGTNVFRLAKTPFAVVDFTVIVKSLKNKNIGIQDYRAVAELCQACEEVGASASGTLSLQYKNKQTDDTSIIGYTPNMVDIDTRTLDQGRYFTPGEDRHAAYVCVIGASLVDQFFPNENPIGRNIRTGSLEFTVIGTFKRLGSVLGQDQDNFVIIPLITYLKVRGSRSSLTLEIKASGGDKTFNAAQDESRVIMRSRRHDPPGKEDSFFIGTSQSYIALWQSISGSFFAVFVIVSSISAVVGGIVIMNVMLVSVTQRTREIGLRRAVGATKTDILRQFLAESLLQCVIGGAVGIAIGFGCALALRNLTSFPASVKLWVALLGLFLSSAIGLFFGIYPARKAAGLDPVTALRTEM
ncbi:MAG TPA: ABC transporter permease [Bryobacteraceae bacterium]|jgi:putative ABC transport system permease protein|nr:ABC transporter permease [Bryobacteraceae bacterium]